MGLIQQKMRAGANQRVAAARAIQIAGAPEDVPATLRALFDRWNTEADGAFEAKQATRGKIGAWLASSDPPIRRHYDMKIMNDGALVVTYGVTAERVLAGKYSKGSFATTHGWLAVITRPESAGDNTTRLTVLLKDWVVDDGGYIWNGAKYAELLNDGLIKELGGQWLSEPPNVEDFQFVRQEGLRTVKG